MSVCACCYNKVKDGKEYCGPCRDKHAHKQEQYDQLVHENLELKRQLAEAMAENGQYKDCLQLLSSIWHHGDFVVETYNEAKLCELMKLLGFWPYKERFGLEG